MFNQGRRNSSGKSRGNNEFIPNVFNSDVEIVNGHCPVLSARFQTVTNVNYSTPYMDITIREGSILESNIYSNGKGTLSLGIYPQGTGMIDIVDDLGKYSNVLIPLDVKGIYFKDSSAPKHIEIVNKIINYYGLKL